MAKESTGSGFIDRMNELKLNSSIKLNEMVYEGDTNPATLDELREN
eukprot:CAMPEP_0116924936 /NCGR_PEP_ID=MMETSP0467-20121206/23825_1 /TAXON_ID=283647 /ORGANISM="Mesodinium pulex, Strain SPMC105" /LENGTH=45 /DNA_ID= /DNA_START= /DNA_END= /DNA_ORIENTATION=